MVAAWYGTRRKTHRDGRQECRSRSTTDGRPMALHPRSPVQRRVTILRRLKNKKLRALRFYDCDGGPMALRSPKSPAHRPQAGGAMKTRILNFLKVIFLLFAALFLCAQTPAPPYVP